MPFAHQGSVVRTGDPLRVLVGRQHGGLAVYMRATAEVVDADGILVRLHTSGAWIQTLELIEIPPAVRAALRQTPASPRLSLTASGAQTSPPLWRLDEPPAPEAGASIRRHVHSEPGPTPSRSRA